MSGYVGDLSSKQEQKLNELKENLKDIIDADFDEHTLLRFLRARSFDVRKSETLLRKDLEWRARLGVNQLKDNFKLPEVCQKYWPGGFVGHDKEGRPVWVEPLGMADPRGLLHSCKSNDLINFVICRLESFLEAINQQTQKLGKPISGVTLIMDLEGLGRFHLWKPGVDFYNKLNLIMQDHYPESLHRLIVIRAPKIFPIAYALCRPILSVETRRKIHVLGSDWKEVLLSYISEDVLPVHWGGKATDPDGNPKCPSKICLGGEVPTSYYFEDVSFSDENMTEREIKRASKLEFKYNVRKPGSFFRYAFKTKHHDIAFGIKRIDSNGQKVKIVETSRVNSHFVLEDGQVELEHTGYYVFKFDNSYSWTKPKSIKYMLELLEPVGDLDDEHVSSTYGSKKEEEKNQNKDEEGGKVEDMNDKIDKHIVENGKGHNEADGIDEQNVKKDAINGIESEKSEVSDIQDVQNQSEVTISNKNNELENVSENKTAMDAVKDKNEETETVSEPPFKEDLIDVTEGEKSKYIVKEENNVVQSEILDKENEEVVRNTNDVSIVENNEYIVIENTSNSEDDQNKNIQDEQVKELENNEEVKEPESIPDEEVNEMENIQEEEVKEPENIQEEEVKEPENIPDEEVKEMGNIQEEEVKERENIQEEEVKEPENIPEEVKEPENTPDEEVKEPENIPDEEVKEQEHIPDLEVKEPAHIPVQQ